MDSHQYQALALHFQNRRLLPWEPEHAIFIKAEIAKLEVLEPQDAKGYKEFYEKRMQEYVEAQKVQAEELKKEAEAREAYAKERLVGFSAESPVEVSIVPEVSPETPVEAPEGEPKKKRKYKKKKIS